MPLNGRSIPFIILRMLTKSDHKKLKEIFATKEDLGNAIKELIAFIQASAQAVKKETVMEIRQAIREEIAPVLFNHESRIRNLETKQN